MVMGAFPSWPGVSSARGYEGYTSAGLTSVRLWIEIDNEIWPFPSSSPADWVSAHSSRGIDAVYSYSMGQKLAVEIDEPRTIGASGHWHNDILLVELPVI